MFDLQPGQTSMWFSLGFKPSSNPEDYVKIVNNRVKFTTEGTIYYTYKGKDYELKIPKITKDVEVGYNREDLHWSYGNCDGDV